MNSLGKPIPVSTQYTRLARVGVGGSGHILVNYDCESSVFMAGLPPGPRGSCAANTSAAAVPVVNGSIAATEKGVRLGTSAGRTVNM